VGHVVRKEYALASSDSELVKRFQDGDLSVFEALVTPYSTRLFNTLVQMTNDRGAAEDLLQEALVAAYRTLCSFRAEAAVYTWLHRIAVNKALNWLRSRKGRLEFESLDDPISTQSGEVRREVPDSRANPAGQALASEMSEVLQEAIASLSDTYRTVFTLREIDGLDYEEIARLCKCSQEAVRTRLHRAKRELKERLRPYLEDREAHV
jgi:RNA polymerase sigma-70 factor, ECF subfamily